MKTAWKEAKSQQPVVMRMVENSLERDRVAHAYVLEGDPGTGKKATALLMAKSLFCLQKKGVVPCETCINCRRIDNGNHPDIHVIEPDGQSIKKEQISFLQREFTKTSVESGWKVYILNQADKMTASAANSLLKFLEEPSAQTVAFLLTEQGSRLLPTILSRCQHLQFRPLQTEHIKAALLERDVPLPMAALVPKLTSNFTEAEQLAADEWIAQARSIVLKLYEGLKGGALSAIVALSSEFHTHVKEKPQMALALDLFLLLHRDLLSVMTGQSQQLAFPDRLAMLQQDALHLSAEELAARMEAILEAKQKLDRNMNHQLLMEQLLLSLQHGRAGGPALLGSYKSE